MCKQTKVTFHSRFRSFGLPGIGEFALPARDSEGWTASVGAHQIRHLRVSSDQGSRSYPGSRADR
jgi:hypothetical protein